MKGIKTYNNFHLDYILDEEIKIWNDISNSLNESDKNILTARINDFLSKHLSRNNIHKFLNKLFSKIKKNKILLVLIGCLIFSFEVDRKVILDSLSNIPGITSSKAKEIINKSVSLHKYENRTENKDLTSYLNDIAQRESSNNWKSISKHNYIGKYQFGESALKECGYNNINVDKFKNNPNIFSESDQDKAMIILLKKNQNYLRKYINKYDNKNINGITITESGLLAAAHLVGQGKVKKFLRSNGKIVPKDGNGVPCTEYLKKFGGYTLNL